LQARVRDLEAENKARREMWEELENRYIDKLIANGEVPIIINQQLRWLEDEYLGGK
jgi:hypothetical protein